MKFTVLGSTGFIGSNLCSFLEKQNIAYFAPGRNYKFTPDENLGHVVYAIGLTADFRQRPLETVDAHVCKLLEVLRTCRYESFLYLSATRVYARIDHLAAETSNLIMDVNDPGDLYNISKIMGEAVCLSFPNDKIRIARLSNVVGDDWNSENFIYSILKEIKVSEKLLLRSEPESCKDYIVINDVVNLLYEISLKGRFRIFNVAGGRNISTRELLDFISDRVEFSYQVAKGSPVISFPQIDISRIKENFSFVPGDIFDKLDQVISVYFKKNSNDSN